MVIHAYDSGEYTVTVRLITSTGGTSATQFIVAKTLKVKFVTNAEDSGAVITVAKTGDIYTGEALYFNSNQQVTATLRDANGGRIQNAASPTGTIGKPTLLAQLVTSLGAVAETLDSPADTGVDELITLHRQLQVLPLFKPLLMVRMAFMA